VNRTCFDIRWGKHAGRELFSLSSAAQAASNIDNECSSPPLLRLLYFQSMAGNGFDLVPGDMGRASWLLVGQQGSMDQTFGSACHGAGRVVDVVHKAGLAKKVARLRPVGVIKG
jgi:RNA-splicing ligase RtcB